MDKIKEEEINLYNTQNKLLFGIYETLIRIECKLDEKPKKKIKTDNKGGD